MLIGASRTGFVSGVHPGVEQLGQHRAELVRLLDEPRDAAQVTHGLVTQRRERRSPDQQGPGPESSIRLTTAARSHVDGTARTSSSVTLPTSGITSRDKMLTPRSAQVCASAARAPGSSGRLTRVRHMVVGPRSPVTTRSASPARQGSAGRRAS